MTTGELRRILIPAGWLNHIMNPLAFPACTSEYSSQDLRTPHFSCIWLIEAIKKTSAGPRKNPARVETPLILLYLGPVDCSNPQVSMYQGTIQTLVESASPTDVSFYLGRVLLERTLQHSSLPSTLYVV